MYGHVSESNKEGLQLDIDCKGSNLAGGRACVAEKL